MALHLNLFHEIEKQKALQRRDPLKLSLYGLGVVAALLAGYYVIQLAQASAASSELARAEADYNKLKPQAEAAQKREGELAGDIKTSDSFVKRIEGRFYWATVLGSLASVVPKEVQVTKLSGDVASDSVRHGTITMDGISAGAEPRKVAEDMRRALVEKFSSNYKHVAAVFSSLDDGKDKVMLNGAPSPTAAFTIKLTMQMQEDEAPAPPVKAGKKTAAGAIL